MLMIENYQGLLLTLSAVLIVTVPMALIDKYEKKAREEHERKR